VVFEAPDAPLEAAFRLEVSALEGNGWEKFCRVGPAEILLVEGVDAAMRYW
jgi:hypothetical protein